MLRSRRKRARYGHLTGTRGRSNSGTDTHYPQPRKKKSRPGSYPNAAPFALLTDQVRFEQLKLASDLSTPTTDSPIASSLTLEARKICLKFVRSLLPTAFALLQPASSAKLVS